MKMRLVKRTRNAETAPMWRTVPEERRQSVFRTIEFLARRGFHASTIARVAGCDEGHVYQACAKLQIRLRDYRDGKGDEAKAVIVRVKQPRFRKAGS